MKVKVEVIRSMIKDQSKIVLLTDLYFGKACIKGQKVVAGNDFITAYSTAMSTIYFGTCTGLREKTFWFIMNFLENCNQDRRYKRREVYTLEVKTC